MNFSGLLWLGNSGAFENVVLAQGIALVYRQEVSGIEWCASKWLAHMAVGTGPQILTGCQQVPQLPANWTYPYATWLSSWHHNNFPQSKQSQMEEAPDFLALVSEVTHHDFYVTAFVWSQSLCSVIFKKKEIRLCLLMLGTSRKLWIYF